MSSRQIDTQNRQTEQTDTHIYTHTQSTDSSAIILLFHQNQSLCISYQQAADIRFHCNSIFSPRWTDRSLLFLFPSFPFSLLFSEQQDLCSVFALYVTISKFGRDRFNYSFFLIHSIQCLNIQISHPRTRCTPFSLVVDCTPT